MNMTLRWYGPGYDSVTLEQIRQIPGVKGVITTLMGKMLERYGRGRDRRVKEDLLRMQACLLWVSSP